MSAEGRQQEPPKFGTVPEPATGKLPPEYSAVEGHDGEIAGYVHTATFEAGGPQPKTPEEAVEFTKNVKGELYEVFNTNGELVGYFATGKHGFVDETQKDELLTQGFRLVAAPHPNQQDRTVPAEEVVPPSTTEGSGGRGA